MKALKNILSLMLIAIAATFCGCTADDSFDTGGYYAQMGTLTKEGRNYYLTLDYEENTYQVSDTTVIAQAGIKSYPQRIFAYYNDLSYDTSGQGSVNLFNFSIAVGGQLSAAPTTDAEGQALGNNYLRIQRAWFGGGYINIEFAYPYNADANTPNQFYMYYAGTDESGCQIYEMRHQFPIEANNYWSHNTMASFYLPNYQEAIAHGAKVRYLDEDGTPQTTNVYIENSCTVSQ